MNIQNELLIIQQESECMETKEGKREYIREKAVELAVQTADSIILEASDGSVEDTDYLTVAVALRFVEKMQYSALSKVNRKAMSERIEAMRKD